MTLVEVMKFVMFCPSSAPPLLHSDYWMGETRGGWGKCHGRAETPEQCMWQWLASLKASKEHCALDPGRNVNSDSFLWWRGKSSSIQAYMCMGLKHIHVGLELSEKCVTEWEKQTWIPLKSEQPGKSVQGSFLLMSRNFSLIQILVINFL